MKHFPPHFRSIGVAVAILAAILLPAASLAQDYGWKVSASPVDPNLNEGSVPPGIANLYLWLSCTTSHLGGASAMETEAAVSPGNTILGFVTSGVVLNAGDATHLLLAFGGCPTGPVAVGYWIVLKQAPLELCLGGTNVTVDCDPAPTAWPHEWLGFKDSGGPCGLTTECGIIHVGVDDSSWGSIKGLYR